MATKNGISATTTDTARALFMLEEIVQAAHNIDMRDAHHPGSSGDELFDANAEIMRTEVCRIGWIAERALIELGASGHLVREGKAENWLMAWCR